MLKGLEAEVMAGIIAKKIINAYNSRIEAEVRLALDSIKWLIKAVQFLGHIALGMNIAVQSRCLLSPSISACEQAGSKTHSIYNSSEYIHYLYLHYVIISLQI